MISAIRDALDRIPTPIKVALWLALSGAVTKLGESLSSGVIRLDPTTLAVANVLLMVVREFLDKAMPSATGAKV